MFKKTMQKMLILDLVLQIMDQIGHSLKEQIKKVIRLMKDELSGKIMKKCVGLKAETYSYLINDCTEDKESKRLKKLCLKRKN